MISLPASVVFDASVVIKRLVPEPDSQLAVDLFNWLWQRSDPTLIFVPSLLFTECANILWKKVRREGMNDQFAKRVFQRLSAMQFSEAPHAGYLDRALEIALASNITVYDASYVALAESLGCQLVTSDSRLCNSLQGSPYQVWSMHDFHARYGS